MVSMESSVLGYLHTVFGSWMKYYSFADSHHGGYYAVCKEGLLFMVMLDGRDNYARITLCDVQSPNRELAHRILSKITEHCIRKFGGWAWVFTHADCPYSSEMLDSVDLCCGTGGGGDPMQDDHLYDGSMPLTEVLKRLAAAR